MNAGAPRALVTGAAQGLGRLLAQKLAARGYELLLSDLNMALLEECASELRSTGAAVHTFPADLSKPLEVQALCEWTLANGARLDLLVNNAGVVFGGAFLGTPLERHRATFEVNTLAPVALVHALLPRLLESKQGGLINIASIAGHIGLPFATTYAASKWALVGFHESLRQELGEQNRKLKLLCVCPSYIDTGMFEGARAPLLMPFLKPDALTNKILKSLDTGRPYLLEPWLAKTVPLLKGILPRFMQDWVFRILGVQHGMKSWRGRR